MADKESVREFLGFKCDDCGERSVCFEGCPIHWKNTGHMVYRRVYAKIED